MKKYIFVFVFLTMVFCTLHAEESTLLGDSNLTHGAYGGYTAKFSLINSNLVLLTGWRGMWVLNNMIGIGFGGYRTRFKPDDDYNLITSNTHLFLKYHGLEAEYVYRSENIAHFTAGMLVGFGQFGVRAGDSSDRSEDADEIFVLEPSVNMELNLAKWCRAGAGASYRVVLDLDDIGPYSNSDVGGFSLQFILKFGWNM